MKILPWREVCGENSVDGEVEASYDSDRWYSALTLINIHLKSLEENEIPPPSTRNMFYKDLQLWDLI